MRSTITIKRDGQTVFSTSVAGLAPTVRGNNEGDGEFGLIVNTGTTTDGELVFWLHGPIEEGLDLSNRILEECMKVLNSKRQPPSQE